ncbi:MAG: N-acetylneuraminate synthase family protein [Candidatus Omnitrophica bacterium]|nr:N-acetylneuraminate synthase family protein [Candidatus Omnitrophota bacterium]
MRIGKKDIRVDTLDPLIIAEVGVNYYDIAAKEGVPLMEAAKRMLREAHLGGADAVKFQTYKSAKIAARDSPAYWDTTKETTRSQFELFQKFDHFGEAEYRELAEYAACIGATFFSTPFDLEAVDFLDPLVPAFKVASADITNLPLLERVAAKRKPILLAVGASSLEEIRRALGVIRGGSPEAEVILLHCILNYPTLPPNANLGMIQGLREEFPDLPIGYSDHVEPSADMLEVTMAVLLGACVIEKHVTLDKSLPGNDHYHAMDPVDLRKLKGQIERCRVLYGRRDKVVIETEAPATRFARRSIVLARAIRAGEALRAEDLIMKRPATGIPPTELDRVIGRRIVRDLPEDEILQWEHLAPEGAGG